jgi:hypothetical protein
MGFAKCLRDLATKRKGTAAGREEAAGLRAKEIADQKAWLREYADCVILPGEKALGELIQEERSAAVSESKLRSS